MKITLLILSLLLALTACNTQNPTHKETVTTYYQAFDSGDFNTIKTVANDSLTIVSGDFVVPYNHVSLYEMFKWDSIFRSSYEIIEMEGKGTEVIATIGQKNLRNAFLQKNPLKYQVKISFTSDKVSKIEELGYTDNDFSVWSAKKDTLVSWVKENHPELDGFVNDMTMTGAMNYLRAIEFYESESKAQ
ncbi:hypothetical protein [Zobellia uliginosa]|uniref:hypothetical protein n=1 Tax=Zobellia uliginosa TaxID=143224 RepID=UPI001C068885|nr:hypothetical protein [Zobellia uliginosa]MBU2947883.1 hypothetical protein [Zobellia uliginosa]